MNSRTFKFITVEKTEGVARLILNRPPVNVLNIEMLNELNAAIANLRNDKTLRLLLISGAGKAFSAGVDVAEHLPNKAEEMLSAFRRAFDLLASMAAPTVAALNGPALGGGCELALACDLVIAAESAKLGQPEIQLATLPPIAAVLLPRLCGVKKAFELLLLGETITARQAERFGLINRAVADEELSAEVDALTKKFSALSSAAVKLTKKAILQGLDKNFAAGLAAAQSLCLNMLLELDDTREGLQAFLEKRPPIYLSR